MKVMNMRLVRAARRIDFAWRLLATLWPAKAAPAAGPPASILLIDLHLIGDMVMLIPLAAALRARYPGTRITLVAGPWSLPILHATGVVDEVVVYEAPWVKAQPRLSGLVGFFRLARELRRLGADIGIDVRGDVRQILLLYLGGCKRRVGFDFTGGARLLTDVVADDGTVRHILDHHERIAARLDAWRGEPFVPRLRLTAEETEAARGIAAYDGFHLGASLPLRQLPPAAAAELIGRAYRPDRQAVLFATPDMDKYVEEVLSLLPASQASRMQVWRGGLRDFVVQVSRAARMFTMDSGPAHVAAALGVDTVVFFGPNLPLATAPRGHRVRVVEDRTVPCRPCDQHHCINPVHQACMRGLVHTVASQEILP
jgi:heptosyltransferase-2